MLEGSNAEPLRGQEAEMEKKKKRNIILCSDGTGNKGGYGADTNVFKIFNVVDIHNEETEQITFYDDGVGTSTNKFIRAITGAFGLGFRQNVKDLYEFLARNYEPGDKIFLFGFSRGAATVRAFAGMIQECGLLDRNHADCKKGGEFDEQKFEEQIGEAIKAYVMHECCPRHALEFKKKAVKEPLMIKMIGVWDTVSALGFPQDWSKIVNWLFRLLDTVTDLWPPLAHNFYNYQLDASVEHVYHALAIDDERQTFHPKVWDEIERKPAKKTWCERMARLFGRKAPRTRTFDRPKHIEQVWFAGPHSNVGGGYERAGMSLVALDWMIERAIRHGIVLKNHVKDEITADADVHDKLYDSRDGVALYYRYAPRDIEALCAGRLEGPIKIHRSVIDRLKRKTLRYAPTFLPRKFQVVGTELDKNGNPVDRPMTVDMGSENSEKAKASGFDERRSEVNRSVRKGKRLYRLFVETTLALIVVAIWLWNHPRVPDFPGDPPGGWRVVAGHVADALHYALPEFLEPFVTYAVIVNPWFGLAIVMALAIFYASRESMIKSEQEACEKVRDLIVQEYRKSAKEGRK